MGASTTRWLAGLLVASIISLVLLVGRMGAPMFDAGHVASAVGWPERAAFPEMDMEQPGASQQPTRASMTLLQWLAHTDPFPPRPASETAASPRLQRQFATAIHNGGISIGTSVAPPPSVKQQAKPISGKKMLFDPSSTLVRYTDRGDCGPRGDDAQADLTQCALGYTTVEEVPNQNYETRASVNGCDFFGWTVYACRA